MIPEKSFHSTAPFASLQKPVLFSDRPFFHLLTGQTDPDSFSEGWNSAIYTLKSNPGLARQVLGIPEPRPVEAPRPRIKRVIFNNPATVIIWEDGVKTVVKCQPGDTFNPETGLAMAMLKRFMGNDNTFNRVITRILGEAVPALPAAAESTEDAQ